jgi:carbon starvation protein
MALVLSAFALTTVDTAIRLGRYFTEDAIADPATSVLGNRHVNSAVQALLAYLLVVSGGWATVWPLFGSSVQLFAGLSMLGVVVWLVNWDASKEILSIGLSALFIVVTSAGALVYLGVSNLRTRLLNPSWLADATAVMVASAGVRLLAVGVLLGLAAEVTRLAYRHLDRQDRTPEVSLTADD